MQNVSQHDVTHLAKLARLDVSEEDIKRYAGQLSDVVAYVEALKDVNVADGKAALRTRPVDSIVAADQLRGEADQWSVLPEDILAGAPLAENHYFVVQSVLSEE